jgi:hypothetical protein
MAPPVIAISPWEVVAPRPRTNSYTILKEKGSSFDEPFFALSFFAVCDLAGPTDHRLRLDQYDGTQNRFAIRG